MSELTKRDITVCVDAFPDADIGVFRIEAADEVLRLLADAHETEFTVAELVDATGVARSTVWRAIDLLDSVGAIRVRETPQRNYVSIDPNRLHKDDPVLAISQPEFHEPVRAFLDRVREELAATDDVTALLGVVVFGSVARGEADRQSDLDLFVVVEGDRTTARRVVTEVVADLGDRRFDGDRFDYEPYVESAQSARRAGPKLREILEEGITVYGNERFQSLRKEALTGE